jgi:hypothetical protein
MLTRGNTGSWINFGRIRCALCVMPVLILMHAGASAAADTALVGLWQGTVSVHAVSEPAGPEPMRPVPTGAPFRFPILLHHDAIGETRLLKQVVLLWQPEPGAYLLIADPLRLPARVPDEPLEARRLSSTGFDFAGNSLPAQGELAAGGKLELVVEIGRDLPTNPFRHAGHPDHDDLDEAGRPLPPERAEVYAIRRAIEIAIDDQDGDILEGRYREVISGLHRQNIMVEGDLRLQRVTRSDRLER